MIWNWQQPGWPEFTFDAAQLQLPEEQFLQEAGYLRGLLAHVPQSEQTELKVDTLSEEAFSTSEIEGEHLNRDSLQSSLRRNLGLTVHRGSFKRAEQGIADMMTDLYHHYSEPLTQEVLFDWHQKLMADNRHIEEIGIYRTHSDPMQVVSGALHKPKIHFEAPPSSLVPVEMSRFIEWFNNPDQQGTGPLPALTRAGIAHLYFESIHPFEDGNGRIGRALILKALCQNMKQPLLLALSHTIQKNKKAYYEALEKANKSIEITSWLIYFAHMVLDALAYTNRLVRFTIEKGKFYSRVKGLLNERQQQVLDRMLRDGPDSFPAGINAEKYIRITSTSRATATRDLQELVEKGIFSRTGERKATRYRIVFPI